MRVLVLYATIDGQAERIARRVADVVARSGHAVTVLSGLATEAAGAIVTHDALIVGAAVRYGHFPRGLERMLRASAQAIAARPNAFFSVSLSARAGGNPGEVRKYGEQFRANTGWQPQTSADFAGALLYRQYNPFMRLVMRLISKMAGSSTDTSRDHEYTDWAAVDTFARTFAEKLGPGPSLPLQPPG